MTSLSLPNSEGDYRRHNNNCAKAPRPSSLSTIRREVLDGTTTTALLRHGRHLSPRFGGSFSRAQQQLRYCATTFPSLHASKGVLLRTKRFLHASEGASLRSSLLSTFRREHTYDKTANSRTLLKTRLILGGSVRDQSLQYRSLQD